MDTWLRNCLGVFPPRFLNLCKERLEEFVNNLSCSWSWPTRIDPNPVGDLHANRDLLLNST